ncbi:uncharacterized protein BDZ83DRAFT_118971 [Colletotrichum acutatum]|uniref:Uncharacterized protein n=1 Tax=Glomerella acutata TaxID=27357 RepID=A0AAD8UCV6_GLOAC|nr:uncharacterized protein BDZ83DRAFT_118971 [Colletotrichum acutatum]KAK1711271.1 hypothetical protein BDZ83DRAFT_118971 [Colletotrichum acutatum]
MRFFLPLALFIAAAQAQLILGAIALIEFTIEILEAAEVVATVEVSVDAALTGAEAAETAVVEGTITNVGTTVTRAGEAAIELEGDASLSGFGRVATEGPGFAQGTFTYRQQFPLGVGAGRRATANPQISLNFGARTNAVRSGGTTKINFSNPSLSNVRLTNPGGARTSVRIKGQPVTRLLQSS